MGYMTICKNSSTCIIRLFIWSMIWNPYLEQPIRKKRKKNVYVTTTIERPGLDAHIFP